MTAASARGRRSATEFSFHEDQADAIIRVAAYHRRDYCHSVIWFPLSEHDAIRQLILTSFKRASSAATGLGSLDRLPLELLHDIVLRLDMHAVFKLRQTSLRAREVVQSLPQYQPVALHGLRVFRALLRTQLATHISLYDFYDALITKTCTLCGKFLGFIFLLTWTRCYFHCLLEARETRTQSFASLQKGIRLNGTEKGHLRTLRTLPGTYSMEETSRRFRMRIASTPRQNTTELTALRRNRIYRFMASCALPYYDRRTNKVERGMSCSGCQLALEEGIYHPENEPTAYARDMVYAQDSFLEHFRWCEQAQRLWRSSGEGENDPPELPELCRRGGFFK